MRVAPEERAGMLRCWTFLSSLTIVLAGCAVAKPIAGSIDELGLPSGASITSASLGDDGRMWFGYSRADGGPGIGSLGPSGDRRVYDLSPSAYGYSVNDIAVTVRGDVWLALACYPQTVHCSQAGYARYVSGERGPAALDRRTIGAGTGVPDGIFVDRNTLWVSDQRANAVVVVAPSGRQTTMRIPDPNFHPFGILVTPGAVYVTGQEPGKICVLDRKGARWLTLPDRSSTLTNMALGPDETIWVAEYDANKIVAISKRGVMRSYDIPTADSHPDAVAVDARGVVWFTELYSGRLGQIGRDGAVHDALLPFGVSSPIFVFAAPGGTLYVMGSQSRWLGLSRTFVASRIRASTAFP